MPANGRMMKRFYPKATAPDEMPSFLDFAHGQAEISKHAVLVDKVSSAEVIATMAGRGDQSVVDMVLFIFLWWANYRLYIRLRAKMWLSS